MAASKMRQRLVPYQIKWIASEVSLQGMKDVALKYLDFSENKIKDVFDACMLHDKDTLNSELLKSWAEKNSDDKQVHVSALLIFRMSYIFSAAFWKRSYSFQMCLNLEILCCDSCRSRTQMQKALMLAI